MTFKEFCEGRVKDLENGRDTTPLAAAAWNAALDEAIKETEKMAQSLDNDWNKRLGKADDLVDTCNDVIDILRALKEPGT